MIETLANGYSYESAQRELSNEYQHDRVTMIFIIFCFFVHWTKVTSASEGLKGYTILANSGNNSFGNQNVPLDKTMNDGTHDCLVRILG